MCVCGLLEKVSAWRAIVQAAPRQDPSANQNRGIGLSNSGTNATRFTSPCFFIKPLPLSIISLFIHRVITLLCCCYAFVSLFYPPPFLAFVVYFSVPLIANESDTHLSAEAVFINELLYILTAHLTRLHCISHLFRLCWMDPPDDLIKDSRQELLVL